MKKHKMTQEQLKVVAKDDDSALDCLNYLQDAEGIAAYVAVSKTLDMLGELNISGKILGQLWDISERDIMVFTGMLMSMPKAVSLVMNVIGEIPNGIIPSVKEIAEKARLQAIERNVYSEDKSRYYLTSLK